jgi:uncharacterized membrane protein
MEADRSKLRHGWGPEYLFAGLLAVFGSAFAFIIPPVQTPDEPSHFHRAYQVSEGRLMTIPVGEWGGGEVPESVLQVSEEFGFLIFHTELHTTAEPFQTLSALPLNPTERRAVPFPGSAYYSFVPYVPQALGIAAARAAGGGPLTLLYAGRLANLALAVTLVFWAIRVMPFFKLVLGTVALLPISVQQFASQNADASTIGVAFVFVAYLLRWATRSDALMARRDLGVMFGLAAWLTLCKFPYSLLALLYLAIPVACLGSRKRYLQVGVTLLLMVFGLAAALTQLKHNTPDRLVPDGHGASITKQSEFIRGHPLRYAKIMVSTVAEHGRIWIDQLSMLGWLDTAVNPLAMQMYLMVMVVVALGDRNPQSAPNWRMVGLGLIAAAACMVVILTSCYVVGCPVRAQLIIGPQGRYFVPLIPLLMLPLYTRWVELRIDRRMLVTLAGAACCCILVVAAVSLVRRYYFPPERQPLFAMVGVGFAGGLFLVMAATARWLLQTPHARRLAYGLGSVDSFKVTVTTSDASPETRMFPGCESRVPR